MSITDNEVLKLDHLKIIASDLKHKVTKNLVENTKDQSQQGTIVEYTSAFDFNCPIDFEKRTEYLKELYHIYDTE